MSTVKHIATSTDTYDIGGSGGGELTPASATELGGVIIGDNVSVQDDGTISVPAASSTSYGVVKVGEGLEIDDSGNLVLEEPQSQCPIEEATLDEEDEVLYLTIRSQQ